jgi:hypothetical protein
MIGVKIRVAPQMFQCGDGARDRIAQDRQDGRAGGQGETQILGKMSGGKTEC